MEKEKLTHTESAINSDKAHTPAAAPAYQRKQSGIWNIHYTKDILCSLKFSRVKIFEDFMNFCLASKILISKFKSFKDTS